LGKFVHGRELAPIDRRGIIRPNRDTLYSLAVFNFDAGPVTVTLPDPGKRYMVMQVANEDQYTPAVYYGAGSHTLTKEGIGTRYGIVVVRAFFDPTNPQDVQQVHALQDAVKVSQQSPGTLEVPNWDQASLKKVRAALLQLGETISDTRRMFGANEDQVDPVRHLVGSALVWGGLPEKDALYLPITPAQNDGDTVHKLTVKDVPVDGFWSITVYNSEGYLEPNQYNTYSVNTITAKKRHRRLGRHSVWRLRRRNSQLLADHEGLELHGPPVPPATRNPQWHMEIPRGAACELRPANVRSPRHARCPSLTRRGPVNHTTGYLRNVHAGLFGEDGGTTLSRESFSGSEIEEGA
jgi:hypothetical protein